MDSSGGQRVALITGAARRVGAALLLRLHELGWHTVLHYGHSQTEAERLAAHCNARRADSVTLLRADLGQPQEVAELCGHMRQRFDGLGALVNSAAVFQAQPLDSAPADLMHTLAVNAQAPLLLCHHLADLLRAGDGRVLNLVDAVRVRPGFVAYDMSKAALRAMTATLARDLAPLPVNALALGHVLPPVTGGDSARGGDGAGRAGAGRAETEGSDWLHAQQPAAGSNLALTLDRAVQLLTEAAPGTGQCIEVG